MTLKFDIVNLISFVLTSICSIQSAWLQFVNWDQNDSPNLTQNIERTLLFKKSQFPILLLHVEYISKLSEDMLSVTLHLMSRISLHSANKFLRSAFHNKWPN